jgi:hypothetical protein
LLTTYQVSTKVNSPAHNSPEVIERVRKLGIAVRKVRGARDESDELIRLADAVAGFVRDALEGSSVMQALFDQALRRGVIRKV